MVDQLIETKEIYKPQEGFVEIFGARTHYKRSGVGETQILISGWLASSQAFDRVMPMLSKNNDCITIDLPGFGVSEQFPTKKHTIENYGKLIIEFMDRMRIGRASFIGDSMGGLVGVDVVSKNPERFSHMVLQGTPNFPSATKSLVRRIPSGYAAKMSEDIARRAILVDALRWINPEFSGQTLDERRKTTDRILNLSGRAAVESFKDMVAYDLSQNARNIRVPTLVVEGSHVSKTPFSSSRILEKSIDNCQIALVDNGTHTLLLKKPLEFSEAVLDFSRRTTNA